MNRGDTCFTSNLPIIAGNYDVNLKQGVYFEITIRKMERDGTIALGMQCLPYPPHRLPGWHRKSAALHLDDYRIYFEDSEGGRDYFDAQDKKRFKISKNDTLGCGYQYNKGVGHLFYTHNGALLPIAFHAIFDHKANEQEVDVFAAVGVTDGPCHFDVNFGLQPFIWHGPPHSSKSPGQQEKWTYEEWEKFKEEWTVEGIFRRHDPVSISDRADNPPPPPAYVRV
ncbi:hypothetical protein C8R44DRAFT_611637 [Mycena epipterygia]|nr:hypothetical protein C8R44DRAFT_611637 [Mycena epipterygia]